MLGTRCDVDVFILVQFWCDIFVTAFAYPVSSARGVTACRPSELGTGVPACRLTGLGHALDRQVARKVVMLENDLERAEERAETGES